MIEEPRPTLKVVIAWSDRRNLCTIISDALDASAGTVGTGAVDPLDAIAGADEVRKLSDEAYVAHTALSAAELRDRLREILGESESVLVAEFEVWSGHGEALDARWLLARGH